ncbi:Hypothetical protein R9X50_00055800 [Acrodontium crateriforme]|uniref:G1/S-specific cyclin pas1 n=1 Tax=Acrodontium crateriforme TaxID=150365 RepID=A0AAQ3R997_9PEZI|nr:Hypothetical protein R9X50_00055800 [Acrodontium crateriforme]
MTQPTSDPDFDGLHQPCEPYEASIGSSASSSQISVFSDASGQSSIASSISDDFRQSNELTQPQKNNAEWQAQYESILRARRSPAPTYADVTSVPVEQRQHPRRCSIARNHKPPTLVRQCDRKELFVDNLVDAATQMVEVIWPLSVVPCKRGASNSRGVLPLRTYIEETLKRSRTSYSTLQVALYYLILIKPFVPKSDFTMEQQMDCPANRALMCGRRMFLSALILASKYLQDRNYSAKAWSKMSGLPVNEINSNERTFLAKVCWKLHIPELIFSRWTQVVLRYSPNMPPPSPTKPGFTLGSWKSVIPLLTPELDQVPIPDTKAKIPAQQCPGNFGFTSSTSTPTRSTLNPINLESTSHESTPTPLTVLPRFIEPRPDMAPPTPALARMGPLPTPQMTPSSVASSTPAASICGSRRPSICSAMALAQRVGMNRCAIDAYPSIDPFYPNSRRQSIYSASSGSSPESMLSDRSRSSRASSISSISNVSTAASMAPKRACLAREATCRSARLPLPATLKEEREGDATNPIIISDDTDMVSSPEFADFSISEKVMYAPHRHSRSVAPVAPTTSSLEKSRKRARPRGGRRSDLQEEVRMLLEEELDAMMDVDDGSTDGTSSPSPAAEYASKMLQSDVLSSFTCQAQPLAHRETWRVPVQKFEGKKRTCCTASKMHFISSTPPARFMAEVA